MKFKIYCINLYERKDRYKFMKNEFNKYNLKVHFIRNYKHKLGGRYGCFDSHIQCLKNAKKHNLDMCLIFEDDIKLYDNCIINIQKCIEFLKNNKNYEIIYANGRQDLYKTLNIIKELSVCHNIKIDKNLDIKGTILISDKNTIFIGRKNIKSYVFSATFPAFNYYLIGNFFSELKQQD